MRVGPVVLVAVLAALAGALYGLLVPVPALFPLAEAVLPGLLTFGLALAALLALPDRLLWSDAARLVHGFRARHDTTPEAAAQALEAITKTHAQAERLRRASAGFRDDLKERTAAIADRLDEIARVVYYAPDRLRQVRQPLVRTDLVVEAAEAHGKLRELRSAGPEVERSRERLFDTLASLDAALDAAELSEVRKALDRVEISSSVAETVLSRHRT